MKLGNYEYVDTLIGQSGIVPLINDHKRRNKHKTSIQFRFQIFHCH